MLDFKQAIAILKDNGFDSVSSYPLVYYRGNKIGLTYTFDSLYYGNLERVKLFQDEKEFDLFVKEIKWYKANGKKKNVAIVLDSYTEENPQVSFVHNGQEITYEIMENIDKYEEDAKNELESSDIKRIIFEIQRLFNYYDSRKEYLADYIDSVNRSMELLFNSYKLLQSRIDLYNNFEGERDYQEVAIGRLELDVDISKHNALSDEFNHLKVSDTGYEDFVKLLKQVYSLVMDLELNKTYIIAMKLQNDVTNEQNLLNLKLQFMEKILNKRGFFKGIKNIDKKFSRIERKFKPNILDERYDDIYRNQVIDRYKRFEKINIFNTAAYLNDSLVTTNYDELVNKYKDRLAINLDSDKATESMVVEDLYTQYNLLGQEEKDKLTLLNSEYFELFRMLINLGDYQVKSGEELVNALASQPNYAAVMGRCYTLVNEILPFNENENIVRIFSYLNFDSPESFLLSLVKVLNDLISISRKMAINYDICTYLRTLNYDNYNDKLMKVYFDSARILCDVKDENLRYVITNLKKATNVFYSGKTLYIPVNGESEIKCLDNEINSLVLLNRNIIMEKIPGEVKVSNYRGNVVRDATYSYIDELKSNIDFTFVSWEISKKL